jgi:hypothetical protein
MIPDKQLFKNSDLILKVSLNYDSQKYNLSKYENFILIYFTPTFVECIYNIQDWWNYYHFMPCLPCGAVV